MFEISDSRSRLIATYMQYKCKTGTVIPFNPGFINQATITKTHYNTILTTHSNKTVTVDNTNDAVNNISTYLTGFAKALHLHTSDFSALVTCNSNTLKGITVKFLHIVKQ